MNRHVYASTEKQYIYSKKKTMTFVKHPGAWPGLFQGRGRGGTRAQKRGKVGAFEGGGGTIAR